MLAAQPQRVYVLTAKAGLLAAEATSEVEAADAAELKAAETELESLE